MKRHWLLLLFPVALIVILVAVRYFSKKPTPAVEEVTLAKPMAVLKETAVVTNAPIDAVPNRNSNQQLLAPEVAAKVTSSLEKYIKDNPKAADISEAYFNLGNAYYQAGQYEKAIDPLRKALEQDQNDADAHYTLGNAYDKLKQYKEAAREFEALTKIEPKNDSVFYNLGNAYSNLKEDEKAREQYHRALALNPKNSAAHYALGMVYNRLHKGKEATEEFQQTVNLEPNHGEARYFLGIAKLLNGDRKGAMEQYDHLKRLNPKAADDLNKRMNP